ncbi:hypothetical protein C8F01DRAFT_510571 [Mycena amicta]|nr:hypothetical protein C8F01DRAFT_510571 [Mycena amicta]
MLPPGPTSAARKRRAAIDAEIARLERSIGTIRETMKNLERERHSLVPIHLIPPEILLEIFRFIPGLVTAPRRLHHLMLVCRRWHDVSTSNSSLWTDVHLLSWKWDFWRLGLAHRYSRQSVRYLRVSHVDSLRTLDAQNRVRFAQVAKSLVLLEMKGNPWTMKPVLALMQKMDFPALQSVKLQCTGDGASDDADWSSWNAPLHRMPLVRSVSLRWMTTVHWIQLNALHSLELQHCHALTVPVLLNILNASPHLHSLILDATMSPVVDAATPPHPPTVHLPLLEQLYICERPELLDAMLDGLTFPLTTRLSLSTSDIYVSLSDVQGILQAARKHLRSPGSLPGHVLRIEFGPWKLPGDPLSFQILSGISEYSIFSVGCAPRLPEGGDNAQLSLIVHALLDIISTPTLHTLAVFEYCIDKVLLPVDWRDVFSKISPPKTIILRPGNGTAALMAQLTKHDALRALQSIRIDHRSGRRRFPGMCTADTDIIPVDDERDTTAFIAALVELLDAHMASGSALPLCLEPGDRHQG